MKEVVLDRVEEDLLRPTGPVRLLTHPRYFDTSSIQVLHDC